MLWGTIGVSTNGVYKLARANAFSIGFWRMAFSVPVLALLAWRAMGGQALRVARRDLGLMLVVGVAMAAYQVCLFSAIPRLGVTVAVIITICSAPVMVAVLAALFFKESLTLRVGLALALAIGGTVLLALQEPENVSFGDDALTGVLLALSAGLSYAMVALCSRALANRYHPLQSISIGFTASALILFPIALTNNLITSFPPAAWGLLLYLGVVPTALAYWLYLQGLKHTSATHASIIALLEPLTAAILAALIFGERLQPLGWVGAVLLLGAMGILLVRPGQSAITNLQ